MQPQPQFSCELRAKVFFEPSSGGLDFEPQGSEIDLLPRARTPKQENGEATQ